MPLHDGTGRVKLAFRSLEKDNSVQSEKTITVPTGVSAFDAASWNELQLIPPVVDMERAKSAE